MTYSFCCCFRRPLHISPCACAHMCARKDDDQAYITFPILLSFSPRAFFFNLALTMRVDKRYFSRTYTPSLLFTQSGSPSALSLSHSLSLSHPLSFFFLYQFLPPSSIVVLARGDTTATTRRLTDLRTSRTHTGDRTGV
jgi:hypothetical protein